MGLGRVGKYKGCTDAELVILYREEGDERAFTELYGRYIGKVTGKIALFIGDYARAQEVAQETFLRVTRHIHNFDTSKSFNTWVFVIARNLSNNVIRDRKRNIVKPYAALPEDAAAIQAVDRADIERDTAARQELQRVTELLVRLPPDLCEALELHVWDGMNHREIADELGISVPVVKSRIAKARQLLQEADVEQEQVDIWSELSSEETEKVALR